MSRVIKQNHFITSEEYLEKELTAEVKHEYINGNIYTIIKGNPDAGIKLKGLDLKNCAYSSITRMELLGFPSITLENNISIT